MPPSAPLERAALERVIAPFGESLTMPADAYVSPDVFEWETEHIFGSTWVCVGRTDEVLVPGQARAIRAGAETVLLTRSPNDELRAFANTCRHRGHELAGVGDAFDVRLIRCPYHSWSYRLDGSLNAAPTLTQADGFDPDDYPLVSVAAETWEGFLFVDGSNRAEALSTHIGNLAALVADYELDRVVEIASHGYDVAANWKTIVENYNECYHCSSIHPELCEVTPPESGADIQPTGLWCGGTMDLKPHADTMSLDGRSHGAAFRRLDGARLRQVLYVTLFPNLLMSLHPDYLLVHRLTPLAPDRTHVECTWLFAPEAAEMNDFDPGYAVEFWDVTNREDWGACEAVNRGLRNRGYRPGPLSSWEGTVYQWLGLLARSYLGDGFVVPQVPDSAPRGSVSTAGRTAGDVG